MHTVAIWNCSAKDLSGQMLARSCKDFTSQGYVQFCVAEDTHITGRQRPHICDKGCSITHKLWRAASVAKCKPFSKNRRCSVSVWYIHQCTKASRQCTHYASLCECESAPFCSLFLDLEFAIRMAAIANTPAVILRSKDDLCAGGVRGAGLLPYTQ